MRLPTFLASSAAVMRREMLRGQLIEEAVVTFDTVTRARLQGWSRPEVAGYIRAKVGLLLRHRLEASSEVLNEDQQAQMLSEVFDELTKLLRAELPTPQKMAA